MTSSSAPSNSAIVKYGAIQPHVHDTYRHRWGFDEDEDFAAEDAREAYEQSVNWRSPNAAKSAAYQAGRGTREAIGSAAAAIQALEYTPPQWIGDVAAAELEGIKKELARQNRLAHRQVYSKLLSWNTYSLGLALLTMGTVNVYMALASQFSLPLGQYADRGFVGTTDAVYTKEIKEGDNINGYTVTSGFGERDAPDTNQGKGSSFHEGVDLDTPEGTNLYMIGEGGTVECEQQPEGAGTYAIITPKGLPYTFKAMHLSKCEAGEYQTGLAFGQTGNTGNSSGAHLHWGMFKDGKAIAPTEGYLWWALTGNAPKPHGGALAETGFDGVDDFAKAIAQQESGGDISIVNSIGAMGKYQFMPDTLDSISQSCFGRQVSHDEFLASETMQDQAAKCYWQPEINKVQQATSDPVQQCRMMASYHYSGDAEAWDSNASQVDAPTIADYTKQVCGKIQG
ncbi:MAG: peptidoglycan DD-metalloendopeptidase family protein [Drouetiella hepatica Uher 2000/2452]|uniref:Peptidoglycan DD-metalloendopeptidase family protein n=1 Tax=Drouetiella hepatica Uher 2000/2452 TaxID=904376 RepID=A0A951UNQ3_9CYAN|nr:peptidoglycan DD-metalloendopeptidase family protein [Drouetiella hepatica Uher 2000/2452]